METEMNINNLPKIMQDAINALKTLHNAPLEMSIPAVLGVMNLACQSRYDVDTTEYKIKPLSLNLIVMAPSGAGKSTIYKELMEGANRWLSEKTDDFEQEQLMYEDAAEKYQNDLKQWRKDNKDVPVEIAILTRPNKPKPLPTHNYIFGKSTLNGMIEQLKTQPFIGLFSAEGAELFNGYAFQGGPKALAQSTELVSALTQLWEAERITKNTGIESISLENRRGNMLILVQEEPFREFLNNSMFSGQGFTHRLLISHCDLFVKHDLPVTDLEIANRQMLIKTTRQSLQSFHNRIYDIMNSTLDLKPNRNFELELTPIKPTKDAIKLLNKYANSVKNNPPFDMDSQWYGFINRPHEIPLRIAGTIAAFARTWKPLADPVITEDDIANAIEIYDWYIAQRKSLSTQLAARNPQMMADAKKLSDWMSGVEWDGTMRELVQAKPLGFHKLDIEQRKAILNEVEQLGKIEVYRDGKATKFRAVKYD